MEVLKNISLKKYNTFGIDCFAPILYDVTSVEELKELIKNHKEFLVIGGGSNILLTNNISNPVIHINTKGIRVQPFDDNHVLVTAQAGENWHDFVRWCINKNYGGIENLSLIPGNVGTSPIQNIGAYGVELKDVFYELEALEISSGKSKLFTKSDCQFGYRDSIFKNELKGAYIILSVTFKLTTKNHVLHTSYGAIKDVLKDKSSITISDISEAVISIRKSKLPDPQKIGNSGSFFKNPIISKVVFDQIRENYPDIPSYYVNDELVKVPAGWLIEKCDFKGKKFGNAGVHHQQALVLVNYGNATGDEIYNLAITIQHSVKTTFDIMLEMEVNII